MGEPTVYGQIKVFLERHPNATWKDIAKETGFSRATIEANMTVIRKNEPPSRVPFRNR